MNRSPLNETQRGRKKTVGMAAAKRKDEGKKKRNSKTSHVKKLKVCSLLMTTCVMSKIRMVACQENTVMTTGCSAIAADIGFTRLVLRNVEWSIRQIICGNCS